MATAEDVQQIPGVSRPLRKRSRTEQPNISTPVWYQRHFGANGDDVLTLELVIKHCEIVRDIIKYYTLSSSLAHQLEVFQNLHNIRKGLELSGGVRMHSCSSMLSSLQAFAGIVTVSVGHCHPEVVKAVNQQSEILQHTTTIYLNHQIAEYAKELADKMPGNLKCVYFVNSGSEANDMAMMLARTFTGNWDLIGLRNAYHGMSIATMGTCGQHTWKQPMPQGFGIHHALNPDPYRGVFGNDGPAYARDVQDLIQSATSGKVAGFMAETIQGVGGATPLAAGYLPEVYKMVRAAGGITIADEVQTGFGRTGSAYWGFQNQGVLPDIVTMAKGMGNGLPLAAVVTTPEIAASMASRLHFNTFGGNPVCSAGGRAVLRVIDNEQLQANCARVGQHLVARLQQLAQKHSIIGDVRGQGLMLGVEFVKDKATKEPASKEVVEVMERMKDMGVLMGKGGIYGNVFRIKPPMCFNIADADFLVDVMDRAITDGL
ncbi:hypothetical protein QJQ45_015654 [Haematococcus lacustris]|nr:hypothetical protein QJQ45_015654 [Haematococcus lacustris]